MLYLNKIKLTILIFLSATLIGAPSFTNIQPLNIQNFQEQFLASGFSNEHGTVLQSNQAPKVSKQQVLETYGKIPLSFEANQGQTDEQVKFLSRGNGYTLFLTDDEAVLLLVKPVQSEGDNYLDAQKREGTVLRMKLLDANPAPIVGLDELPGKSNYLTGSDPENWHTNVPNYAKVKYDDVYDGIDLIYYGNQNQLEYDFVVSPYADPSTIRLGFDGAKKITLDSNDNLILHVAGGKIIKQAPVIYQEINGEKKTVAGQYVLQGNDQVGFEVGAYDTSIPLVIDPVLVYSTFLGGSSYDTGYDIAVDASGNAYVTGYTGSANFPTATPLDGTFNGAIDAFVSKIGEAQTGTLIVIKNVINDNGGTALAGDFTITVTGNSPSPASFAGAAAGTTVTLNAGTYSVSETGPSGYASTSSTDCAGTIAAGETKTCTITNDDISARDIKRDLKDELHSLLPTGDKHADKRIKEAIERIDESLDDKLWIDDNTLDPKKGEKAIHKEEKAVEKLMEILAKDDDDDDDDDDHDSSLPASVLAAIQQIIDDIVNLDRKLASDAIDNAVASGGDPKEIDRANKELAEGDAKLAKGKFDKAIHHYEKAWKHAQKALGIDDDHHHDDDDDDNDDDDE